MLVSPEDFKKEFLKNGDTIYLASCSLGPVSQKSEESLQKMIDTIRKPELAWITFEKEILKLRDNIANLINADKDQIALIPNASTGAFQIISSMDFQESECLYYCNNEFPSIANVWNAQEEVKTFNFEVGQIDNIIEKSDRGLVSVPFSDFISGNNLITNSKIKLMKLKGFKVFIDAYQAIGVQPIDVKKLNCDFLVAGTMKYLLGLPGLAFLFVRNPKSISNPKLTGWFGRKNPFDFNPHTLDFSESASKLETGTISIASVYTANIGIQLIQNVGLTLIRSHILNLISYAKEKLENNGEHILNFSSSNHGSHIAIIDTNPEAISKYLNLFSIVTSPRGSVLRIAFHYFNSFEDIDIFCKYLKQYREKSNARTKK